MVGITVGVVLLGFVTIGALIAIVTMRKKRAGKEGIVSEDFHRFEALHGNVFIAHFITLRHLYV